MKMELSNPEYPHLKMLLVAENDKPLCLYGKNMKTGRCGVFEHGNGVLKSITSEEGLSVAPFDFWNNTIDAPDDNLDSKGSQVEIQESKESDSDEYPSKDSAE